MVLLAKFIRMRTARSAATASHPSVEHATEGINQYREQSFCQRKPFFIFSAVCSRSLSGSPSG
ncbi:MAG: hypothetical protein E7057_07965 [Lentisphaerae bacterium]|nr:hypothetical protein [Lentisphaerota bacterium]